MIEKMQMVYVVSSLSQKKEMLDGLKDLGILHIAEKKSASREVSDYFQELTRTAGALTDYMPTKKERKAAKGKDPMPIIKGEEFDKLFKEVTETLDIKAKLDREIGADRTEIDRIAPWGEIIPSDIKKLQEEGYDFHFYRLTKNDYKLALENEDVKLFNLAPVEKQTTIAVLGTLPAEIQATEFILPSRSIAELEAEIEEDNKKIAECTEVLKNAAKYDKSFAREIRRVSNDISYSTANETAEKDDDFVWLTGYIPEVDIPDFKKAANEKSWAYAIDDVAEDDEQIPTKLRFNKVSRMIEPVFDILGILPGYRETDISLFFMLFFTLFFAMIIGDGGYGLLILIATSAFVIKTKKNNNATYLLFVLSIATIVWGCITGTWFGTEAAMNIPFLKGLVIPSFASYPEYFGVTSATTQNTIMKFSFTIGAVQMALGSLLAIKKKMSEKNLSWVADLGWMISIVAMYLLALYLVIGQKLNIVPIFALIGVGFVMVLLFGGMEPGIPIGKGIKQGLSGAFTVFLDTISCFGNVMSYIRLFAVGMAGLAISQSFNSIAASMSSGPLIVAAIVVVLIGHSLNIVMCFLSVIVHGVRLNVLEFSGQVGLEWTGIAYEPFKENQID